MLSAPTTRKPGERVLLPWLALAALVTVVVVGAASLVGTPLAGAAAAAFEDELQRARPEVRATGLKYWTA